MRSLTPVRTGVRQENVPVSISGLTAAGRATLPPAGVMGSRPGISFESSAASCRCLGTVSRQRLACDDYLAILTIIFAAFGLWTLLKDQSAKGINGSAYLNIAKIFEGAIVGSTCMGLRSQVRRSPSIDSFSASKVA
jgi:hypothetical protein